MIPRKGEMGAVTFEEVTLAADLWDDGLPATTIADQLWWTDDLLKRVIRLSREGPDDGYFPDFAHRRPKKAQRPQGDIIWSPDGALDVPATPKHAARRKALDAMGIEPSTAPARRVADHTPARPMADPTLALPPEPAAARYAAATAPDGLTLPCLDHPGLFPDEITGLAADEADGVRLVNRTRKQCPFPMWRHDARPDDPAYGQVCGKPVATTGRSEGPEGAATQQSAYCQTHAALCGGTKAETAKQERMNAAAVKQARRLGVA